MQYLRAPVCTICIGQAASMGAVLLAAGATGKRYALPNSRIMIHQGSSGFRGNTPDVEIQMRENLHLVNRLLEILAEHTGQSVEKVKRDSDRDNFMSPDEAKDYGLIDEVFVGNNESLISLAQKNGRRDADGRGGRGGRQAQEVALAAASATDGRARNRSDSRQVAQHARPTAAGGPNSRRV